MTYYTPSYAMRQTRSASSSRRSSASAKRMPGLRRNQNTVQFSSAASSAWRLGPISNAIMLAMILCLLGLLYLTQITKQTSYGYEVNALETQKTELLSEQESLKVESARLQALDRIQNSKVAKQLVEPTSVNFAQ